MSKGKYGVVEISEAERKKQEEERKRRLEEERRRLEEARKREIECRRQKEIAAEKERIALAKKFREMSPIFQQQTSRNKKRRPERKKQDLSVDMRKQAQAMKEQLAAFPSLWREHFNDRLQEIDEVIQKVEEGGFDSYHYHQLKEANRKLAALAGTAEKELETMFRQVKEVKESGEKMLIEMEMVSANALLDEHRRRARTIGAALSSLLQDSHLVRIESRIESLRLASQRLWEEYTQSQEAAQRRHFLMQNVQEVLEEMGYRVLPLEVSPRGLAPRNQTAENILYFRTPGQGMVEMNFAPDQSFAASYVLPRRATAAATEVSAEEAVADCRSWCRDYDNFVRELSQRDVYLGEKGRREATAGRFKEVVVPETFFEEEESSGYWSKGKEKSRRL